MKGVVTLIAVDLYTLGNLFVKYTSCNVRVIHSGQYYLGPGPEMKLDLVYLYYPTVGKV